MRNHITRSAAAPSHVPSLVRAARQGGGDPEAVGWHHIDAEVAAVVRAINELEDAEAVDRDGIVRARDLLRRCAADLLAMSDPTPAPALDEALRAALTPSDPPARGAMGMTRIATSPRTPTRHAADVDPSLATMLGVTLCSHAALEESARIVLPQQTRGAARSSLGARLVASARGLLDRLRAWRTRAAALIAKV